MRFLYSLLLYLLAPWILLRLLIRSRRNPGYRKRVVERFGFFSTLPARPRIWLHAVSVGETIASEPLIRQLREAYPEHALLITSTTPTGSTQVARLFGDLVEHVYLPYDMPGAVHRFLKRSHPIIGICMETEIWPNLFATCARAGIPLMLVNARLSARSFRAYRRFSGLSRSTLAHISVVAARDDADARRFKALGAPRVVVAGNLKYDLRIPLGARESGYRLRQALGVNRPVWIAASTHEGEEEQVLEAHRQLLMVQPNAALILVPRHPERFAAVYTLCVRTGWPLRSRSREEIPDTATRIILGDTVGELPALYAAADVAFVGGSLVPVGGHNPLEPAALELPVLTGPHIFNFEQVYAELFLEQAAERIADAGKLQIPPHASFLVIP